jgi:hypothetical protein
VCAVKGSSFRRLHRVLCVTPTLCFVCFATVSTPPSSKLQRTLCACNDSPPDQPIPFHHELAQTPNPPEYVFFYCHSEPDRGGGETPIIDSTAVYRYAMELDPEFMHRLQHYGVKYTRTLPHVDDPSSPIGRSYQNTWNVTNRDELDQRLAVRLFTPVVFSSIFSHGTWVLVWSSSGNERLYPVHSLTLFFLFCFWPFFVFYFWLI